MGMWAYIGILSFMGIAFFAIGLGTYIYMKRTVSGEKTLMEEVVNEQTRTSKLEFHEILRYVIPIFGAVIFLFYMVRRFGSGSTLLGTSMVTPLLVALFNARKRTGKSIFISIVAMLIFIFLFFAYLLFKYEFAGRI